MGGLEGGITHMHSPDPERDLVASQTHRFLARSEGNAPRSKKDCQITGASPNAKEGVQSLMAFRLSGILLQSKSTLANKLDSFCW